MNTETEPTFVISSRTRRIIAFLIDQFVISFLMVSIVFLSLGTNFTEETDIRKVIMTILGIMLPGFFLYFAKDALKGISLGKWITGIMVRDENNPAEIPSFGRLFIRNLPIVIWPVEFIVLVTDDNKKRIGDKIARTIVVNNPNKPARLPRILALAGIGVAFYLFIFFFVGMAMKNSDAYKVATYEIENNQEILKKTGGIKGYGMFPAGSINLANGNGQAKFKIEVIGNNKNLQITVYLTKEPDEEWKLIKMSE